jgi:hypothetical protein
MTCNFCDMKIDLKKVDVVAVNPNDGSFEICIVFDRQISETLTPIDRDCFLKKINYYISVCEEDGFFKLYPEAKKGKGTISIMSKFRFSAQFINYINPLRNILTSRGIVLKLFEGESLEILEI